MADKDILWIGNALKDLRDLPEDIRGEIGFDLRTIQRREMPRDFKTMSEVGPGAIEIRVKDEKGNIGRCFYVANIGDYVAVLHSFVKKTQKTSKADMEKGRERYRMMEKLLRDLKK